MVIFTVESTFTVVALESVVMVAVLAGPHAANKPIAAMAKPVLMMFFIYFIIKCLRLLNTPI